MLKSIKTLVLLIFILLPVTALAQLVPGSENESQAEPCDVGSVLKCEGAEEGAETLEEVVAGLLNGFDVNSVSQLPCSDIVERDFERVGEALMSYMHPDPEEHERIDDLMGGEGSDSLRNMHVFMGMRYLGCGSGAYGPMMMNFSSRPQFGGMMGAFTAPFSMMSGNYNPLAYAGWSGQNYFYMGFFQMIVWVMAIFGIVWLIQYLSNRKK